MADRGCARCRDLVLCRCRRDLNLSRCLWTNWQRRLRQCRMFHLRSLRCHLPLGSRISQSRVRLAWRTRRPRSPPLSPQGCGPAARRHSTLAHTSRSSAVAPSPRRRCLEIPAHWSWGFHPVHSSASLPPDARWVCVKLTRQRREQERGSASVSWRPSTAACWAARRRRGSREPNRHR